MAGPYMGRVPSGVLKNTYIHTFVYTRHCQWELRNIYFAPSRSRSGTVWQDLYINVPNQSYIKNLLTLTKKVPTTNVIDDSLVRTWNKNELLRTEIVPIHFFVFYEAKIQFFRFRECNPCNIVLPIFPSVCHSHFTRMLLPRDWHYSDKIVKEEQKDRSL